MATKLQILFVLVIAFSFISTATTQLSSSGEEQSYQVGYSSSLLPLSHIGHVTMADHDTYQPQQSNTRERTLAQPNKVIYYNPHLFPNGLSKLVLQWIPSSCKAIACQQTRRRFTLRGFWREIDRTQLHLQDAELPENILDNLESDLLEHWPDLTKGRRNYLGMKKFWKSIYENHGKYFSTFTPEGYFKRGIFLTKRHHVNLFNQLKNGGIWPDNGQKYNPSKIAKLIESYTYHVPEIHCVIGMEDGKNYFAEIRLCYDDDGFEVIDCPLRRSRCDPNGVYFAR